MSIVTTKFFLYNELYVNKNTTYPLTESDFISLFKNIGFCKNGICSYVTSKISIKKAYH